MYSFAAPEFASFMMRYGSQGFRRGTATQRDPTSYNQSVILGVEQAEYTDGYRNVTFTASANSMWLKLEDGKKVICDKAFDDFSEVLIEVEGMLGKVTL